MKFKLRPIFRDISLTFITQAIVLAAFFYIYQLIAKNFGPEGVGKYALIKRVISLLSSFLLLGLWIGIPRYIAMSQERNQRGAYIKAAGSVVTTLTFVFIIFINLFKVQFANIFFGNTKYTNLVLPFSFFFIGLIFFDLVYSYFRGRLFVKTFNFFQIINIALVPLSVLIIFKNITIENFLILIGLSTFFIAVIFSFFYIKEIFIPIKKQQIKSALNELLRYSFPRFLASLVYAGLLSLGPIFAAHFVSIQEVGYLSLSQSILGVVRSGVTPLGLILLPKASSLLVQKKENIIKENLNYLVGAAIQCSFFLCVQLIIFTDVIIKHWLGPEFINAIFISVMRIVFLSIIFYFFHGTMASILEASRLKPINFINLCISFGIFLITSGVLLFLINLFSPIISLGIAFTSGFTCLGILTYISIRKIYPEKLIKDLEYLIIAIGVNIIIGGITISAKSFVVSRLYYLIIFEILICIIYLLILWLLKMDWLKKIPEKILLKAG